MREWDIVHVEEVLEQVELQEKLFTHYKFYREDEKLCLLGKGASSLVYDVVSRSDETKHYALKVMGVGKYRVSSKEFQDTNAIQQSLCKQTEHVVRIIDASEFDVLFQDEACRIQVVLMEGLEDVLVKDRYGNRQIAIQELHTIEGVIKLAKDIGQVIHIAHSNKILHRDIKLENIFWDEANKRYKLGDFGVSKLLEEETAETILYTDGYCPPEIKNRSQENYNATADIYSFGMTIYLLLNDLKFPGSSGYYPTPMQYYGKFIIPAPMGVDLQVLQIIRKMCDFNAKERYQSMEEVLCRFDDISILGNEIQRAYEDDFEDYETELSVDLNPEKDIVLKENKVLGDREKKKKEKRVERKEYFGISIRYLLLFTSLFFLLIVNSNENMMSLEHVMIPIVLYIQVLFLLLKEFHKSFTCIVLLLGVYVIYTSGLSYLLVLLLLCVLTGDFLMIAGAATGISAWLALDLAGITSMFGFIGDFNITWVVLTAFIIAVNEYVWTRAVFNKIKDFAFDIWCEFYEHIAFILLLVGIVAWCVHKIVGASIVSYLVELPLLKIGGVLLLVQLIQKKMDGGA